MCKCIEENIQFDCYQHFDPWQCSEPALVLLEDGSVGIPVRDGGTAYILIDFCPWCGIRLGDLKKLVKPNKNRLLMEVSDVFYLEGRGTVIVGSPDLRELPSYKNGQDVRIWTGTRVLKSKSFRETDCSSSGLCALNVPDLSKENIPVDSWVWFKKDE